MKEIINVKVEGMHCMHCVKRVEDALSQINGISNVKVDLDSKNVSFKYKGEGLDWESLEKTISDLGFELIK